MELAFYADPLEKFVIKKDSTFALMKEAWKEGTGFMLSVSMIWF